MRFRNSSFYDRHRESTIISFYVFQAYFSTVCFITRRFDRHGFITTNSKSNHIFIYTIVYFFQFLFVYHGFEGCLTVHCKIKLFFLYCYSYIINILKEYYTIFVIVYLCIYFNYMYMKMSAHWQIMILKTCIIWIELNLQSVWKYMFLIFKMIC